MKRNAGWISTALLLAAGLAVLPAQTGSNAIIGKWKVKAETPNGPMDLEFEWKVEKGAIVGTATVMSTVIAFSNVKFEDPNLTAEFALDTSSYRLAAVLRDGKLAGAWSQAGSELKGSWTAARAEAPPPVAAAAGSVITGMWETLTSTPNGDFPAKLELTQAGDQLQGRFISEMGELPLQAASFKENRLQLELMLGNAVYRVQATLEGDKFTGNWAPAAGGDGGAWSAKRAAAPSAPAPSAPVPAPGNWAEGSWSAIAVTPEGEMQFQVDIKSTPEGLAGTIVTPEGTLTLKNVKAAGEILSFEIDYMGGSYRIEGKLQDGKLTGKWAAMRGNESGPFNAQRKKN